jgi:hypothetical protein
MVTHKDLVKDRPENFGTVFFVTFFDLCIIAT